MSQYLNHQKCYKKKIKRKHLSTGILDTMETISKFPSKTECFAKSALFQQKLAMRRCAESVPKILISGRGWRRVFAQNRRAESNNGQNGLGADIVDTTTLKKN